MIKRFIKLIGLFVFIGICFFYTDRVINVIKEEDDIMVKLNGIKDSYDYPPINASIISNTVIPGINGKKINIDASYKNMKQGGMFDDNLIVFDKVLPDISVVDNKDKFIVRGNRKKQMVSIVFVLDNNMYLDSVEKILNEKDVIANYFVDYDYLMNNSIRIKEMVNREIYSYGEMGIYTSDNLLFSNNLINRISNNDAIYCLSKNKSKDVLDVCSKSGLYTIVPNLIGTNNIYSLVNNNLCSGSIIFMYMNSDIVYEIPIVIDYIRGKGYKIVGLSLLLSEELN